MADQARDRMREYRPDRPLDARPHVPDEVEIKRVLEGAAELAALLERSSAHRMSVAIGDTRWEIEAPPPVPPVVPARTAPPPHPSPAASPVVDTAGPGQEAAAPAGHEVRAPLVGVFYQAPGPGAEPFTRVGAKVRKGEQLAIVEAMKMMNEITADRDGIVRAVHPADGDVVEFDQVLFTLEPIP